MTILITFNGEAWGRKPPAGAVKQSSYWTRGRAYWVFADAAKADAAFEALTSRRESLFPADAERHTFATAADAQAWQAANNTPAPAA
jgi:hypothetical protein